MKTIRIVTLVLLSLNVTARQGMWMPNLLKQLNAEDLKSMGLSIPVDELFSANGGALNDAIVQFGGGCTGEVISDSGLILTNHHCGYGQLQSLSTLVNNYVRDGFWAKNRLEELPCPGLTVTFVRDIRPVTQVFMDAGIGKLDEGEREKKVKLISDSLEQLFSSGGKLNVFVKAFYNGNQYFLFVTEVFRDVRLVGAPPSDIGNYGGETDNWVWPRHTGDFTVFRIYAGSDNGPADYSTENRPYRPGRSLVINAGGIKEGDFTMVYGFPGRTQQFLPSSSIRMIQTQTNPNRIALRELRMAVWKESMRSNDTIQLKYASKFRSLANAYKKWKGESEGLEKSDAIAKKQAAEVAFKSWANSNPDYRTVIDEINAAVDSSFVTNQVSDYFSEGLNGIELISMANKIRPLMEKWEKSPKDTAGLRVIAAKVSGDISALYKNYDARVDRMACEKILNVCSGNLSGKYRPAFLDVFQKAPDAYLDLLFKKSIFTDESKALASVNDFSNSGMKRLASDPAWKAAEAIIRCRTENIEPEFNRLNTRINQL
ncbi:MAG: S46 family peptidase, partial [Bacteroidota bacterium]